MKKIYLASSWRNTLFDATRDALRAAGHTVFDFRTGSIDPSAPRAGFAWSEVDPDWMKWNAVQYIAALKSDPAQRGYASDRGGMDWADTCVLLLPSGRSAHLEAGFMAGQGKEVHVLTQDGQEPELMALLLASVQPTLAALLATLRPTPEPALAEPKPASKKNGSVIEPYHYLFYGRLVKVRIVQEGKVFFLWTDPQGAGECTEEEFLRNAVRCNSLGRPLRAPTEMKTDTQIWRELHGRR